MSYLLSSMMPAKSAAAARLMHGSRPLALLPDNPTEQGGLAATAEAVLGLLGAQQVLAHPSAALELVDAALQLASALQRAEVAGGDGSSGGEGASPASLVLRQLAAASAPGLPAGTASPELEGLVQRAGFRPADLHSTAAQLALRTAQALAVPGRATSSAGPGVGLPLPGWGSNNSGAAALVPPSADMTRPAPAAADTLLALATVLPPSLQCGSVISSEEATAGGQADLQPQQLVSAAAGGSGLALGLLMGGDLLPLMRRLPLAQHALGQQGWEAYFLLEPLALQQCLAEILQAATTAPLGTSLQQLIRGQQHWAAAAAAVATHPALHLVARRTLHAWLASSGSLAVWGLLVELRRWAVAAAAAAAPQQGAAGGAHAGQPQHGGWDGIAGTALGLDAALKPAGAPEPEPPLWEGGEPAQLPLPLRLLHAAGPARQLAALLHSAPPSPQGVAQAVRLMERHAAPAVQPPPTPPGTGSGAGPPNDAAAAAAVAQEEGRPWGWQVWEVLVDHPRWLCFALQQLPLDQAAAAAAEGPTWATAGDGDRDGGSSGGGGGGSETAAEGVRACASYASWLMWPQYVQRRAALQQALVLRPDGIDPQAVLPWLQMLQQWQAHWESAGPQQPAS